MVEKREKDPKNDLKRVRKYLSPSHAAQKCLTATFLKVFHRPKFAQKMSCHREALQGHAEKLWISRVIP